jgi:hypothetical protein
LRAKLFGQFVEHAGDFFSEFVVIQR